MKYTHIIWDFNGTIINDVVATMQAENAIFARRKLPVFRDLEQFRDEFSLPFKDFYQRMGIDFTKETYEDLSDEFMTAYKTFAKKSQLHDGALDAFNAFKAMNVPQIIISASEITVLNEQIKTLGISKYFDEILGLPDYLAISKEHLAKDWMARNEAATPLFIGDTVHDYEVASSAGIECVLVASGSQRQEQLATYTRAYYNLRECINDIINNSE